MAFRRTREALDVSSVVVHHRFPMKRARTRIHFWDRERYALSRRCVCFFAIHPTRRLPTRFLFLFVFYFIWKASYAVSLRYPKIRISFLSDLSFFKTERKLHCEISVLARSNWDKSMLRYFYVPVTRYSYNTILLRYAFALTRLENWNSSTTIAFNEEQAYLRDTKEKAKQA